MHILKNFNLRPTLKSKNQLFSINTSIKSRVTLKMQQGFPLNYCQHFKNFKATKKITIEQHPFCKFCMSTNNSLWICLHKNCGVVTCSKQNYLHMTSHLEESKKSKSFHSIFINIYTGEIRCVYCNIEILDFDQLKEDESKKLLLTPESNDPLKIRMAVLPYLQSLGLSKLIGQLEYPQGHRKINRGLVGIFADRRNYSVIPAIQFIAQCGFFKDVITTMRLKQDGSSKFTPILKELKTIVKSIQEANQRAIRIDKFMQLMTQQQTNLIGYKKRDPFDSVLQLLNILHEYLNFYKVTNSDKDEWDLYYKSKEIETHCPIYDSLASTLALKYQCTQCQHQEDSSHEINFIKLEFPKKRRKTKIVEKQLNEKGYESPRKRGRSLMSLILPEEQLPITIPELLIEFFKQPFQKEKYCLKCQKEIPMKSGKVEFKKIADILILQINRMPKFSDQTIDTNVLLSYENINLSPFLKQNEKQAKGNSDIHSKENEESQQMNYEFVGAIGIEKGLFPIVCRSKYNNQLYHIKNESVQLLSKKIKFNPYIICLKRVTSSKTSQFYQEIINQNKAIQQSYQQKVFQKSSCVFSKISLPDFYHIQLKHGIQLPVYQPVVCKHNKVKPNVERKCEEGIIITQKMYDHLVQTFTGTRFTNEQCTDCQREVELINKRKIREKQLIKEYDGAKTNANVMVAIGWLKKWSNYLYSQEIPSYFHKGYPLPPPIDNTVLLQQNRCKPNLIKNKDFKVVNILVFKLLKQLYSGGPQIRYKWKANGQSAIEESKMRQIRMQAAQLKSIYCTNESPSPKKLLMLQKINSVMETVNETDRQDEIDLSDPKLESTASSYQ